MKSPVYYAFLAGETAVARIPIGITRTLARLGGLFYYYAKPAKRRIVKRNMRRALGPCATEFQVRRTARKACMYYADYWVDILWLPSRSRQYVLDRFGKVNEPALMRGLTAAGGGAVICLPHYGSWEAGAVFLSSFGPFAAVAEVLRPRELFDLFVKLRAGVGIRIFPYDKSEETREEMVKALHEGTQLALLTDRDLKGTGVEVEFFGEKTTLPPGPAVLAMRAQVPIIVVSVRNVKGGWIGRATEPIMVKESADRDEAIRHTMQEVARRLEELIRVDPAQWHMFMPSWPSDREGVG